MLCLLSIWRACCETGGTDSEKAQKSVLKRLQELACVCEIGVIVDDEVWDGNPNRDKPEQGLNAEYDKVSKAISCICAASIRTH